MQREAVPSSVSTAAFEFFFWFSRFEFGLKANQFLQSHKIGATADPGWKEFVDKFQAGYVPTESAKSLLFLSPQQQVVGRGDTLNWSDVPFLGNATPLHKVVQLLKVVRNNLFHGGKHGGENWDNPQRTEELLKAGQAVLDELAVLGGFEGDYRRYY